MMVGKLSAFLCTGASMRLDDLVHAIRPAASSVERLLLIRVMLTSTSSIVSQADEANFAW